jgi:hypothetical protein
VIASGDGESHTNKGSTGHKGSSSVSGGHGSVAGSTPSSTVSKILKGEYVVKLQMSCRNTYFIKYIHCIYMQWILIVLGKLLKRI